ncbi:MAG: CBS domain-containing protein [Alphaproteobacteria bacterium]|nr:CBS domain-containing protein [Alphaproteobacteria bacterium]
MTTLVMSVAPDTELREIVDLMEKKHIKRVPVVENERVVGIVTRRSLLQGFASLATTPRPTAADDGTLRDMVMAEIRKLPWTPQTSLNVVIHEGVAHLWGVILDERQRRAMCLAAENVSGIKEVHDHLVWVEPVTGISFSSPEDSRQRRLAEDLTAG